jgi:DNA-binding NarL/FixJ family response regulator
MTLFPFQKKPAAPSTPPSMTARLHSAMMQPKALLFVDDDRIMHEFIETVAREFKVRLVQAHSCAEARERLADSGPFIGVILDVVLTNGDGVNIFRQIARETPGVQVVFLSGNDSPELRARVDQIGPARVYSKGITLNPDFVSSLFMQLGIPRLA